MEISTEVKESFRYLNEKSKEVSQYYSDPSILIDDLNTINHKDLISLKSKYEGHDGIVNQLRYKVAQEIYDKGNISFEQFEEFYENTKKKSGNSMKTYSNWFSVLYPFILEIKHKEVLKSFRTIIEFIISYLHLDGKLDYKIVSFRGSRNLGSKIAWAAIYDKRNKRHSDGIQLFFEFEENKVNYCVYDAYNKEDLTERKSFDFERYQIIKTLNLFSAHKNEIFWKIDGSLKICYVWVERFRSFQNFGINLSSSNKFNYLIEENKISRKKIDDLPANFFGDQISEITGLIGKNGAGKSNALELICKVLKGAYTTLNSNFIIITESDNSFTCHYSSNLKNIPNSDLDITFKEYTGLIDPLKEIYFSNVFDGRKNSFNFSVSDLSINKRILNNSKKKITDFQKQIEFIKSKEFDQLNIKSPEKIRFTLLPFTKSYRLLGLNFKYQFGSDVKESVNFLISRIRKINSQDRFIFFLKLEFVLEFYIKIKLFKDLKFNDDFRSIINYYDIIKSIEGKRTKDIIDELLFRVENDFFKMNDILREKFPTSYNTLSGVIDRDLKNFIVSFGEKLVYLKGLKKIPDSLNLVANTEGARLKLIEYFIFDYTDNNNKSFLNKLIYHFNDSRFINIDWIGLSSGHKAYLNLFSIIRYELKRLRVNNLILCIDEGDLYLHPKWQVEFLDKLINVLPKIFGGKIQLVLTSHSPFLLSDLPNQCVTILNNVNGKSVAEDGVNIGINTFGGNLYDLYSEPFFLGKKRTSDFAFSKIISAIDKIENPNLTSSEKEEIKKLAKIIGDEIIQFRINKILAND